MAASRIKNDDQLLIIKKYLRYAGVMIAGNASEPAFGKSVVKKKPARGGLIFRGLGYYGGFVTTE